MPINDSFSYQHVSAELRVFHGSDSLASLKRELDRAGFQRAVVVCGNTISQGSVLDTLRNQMGTSLAAVAATAKEHSPASGVEETVRIFEEVNADAIIAVGGGSAAVTARAASILAGEKKPLAELCTRRLPDGKFESPRLNAPKLPIFVVPTTPSTAFVKAGSAVHDEAGQRLALFDPKTRARGIFVHPEFVATAPVELVRNAALNAFANAVEALESPRCDPISEAFLMQSLRILSRKLPLLEGGTGTEIRENLVIAALLCGRGTEQGGAGLASVLAHAIGRRNHVANGIVNAIVLPHTMHYNMPATQDRQAAILEGLGITAGTEAGKAVSSFLAKLDAPTTLRAIAVPENELLEIAEAAMLDWFISRAPRHVPNAEALKKILQAAW